MSWSKGGTIGSAHAQAGQTTIPAWLLKLKQQKRQKGREFSEDQNDTKKQGNADSIFNVPLHGDRNVTSPQESKHDNGRFANDVPKLVISEDTKNDMKKKNNQQEVVKKEKNTQSEDGVNLMQKPVPKDSRKVSINSLWLRIIFIQFAVVGYAVRVSPNPGRATEYPANCQRINFTNEADMKEISDTLTANKTTSAWLPLHRRQLDGWRWIDNTSFGEAISSPARIVKGRDCGLLRVGEMRIADVPCNKKLQHILCESKDGFCSGISDNAKCIEFEKKAYIIYSNEKSTWYMAKQRCFEKNLVLASLSQEERPAVLKRISEELGYFEKVWIGLRQAEYMEELQNGEFKEINNFHWMDGSPCICPHKKCVIVRDGNWKPEKCSSTHHFLCFDPHERQGSIDAETQNFPPWAIAIICLLVISVLAGVVITCVFKRILRSWVLQTESNDDNNEETESNKETEIESDEKKKVISTLAKELGAAHSMGQKPQIANFIQEISGLNLLGTSLDDVVKKISKALTKVAQKQRGQSADLLWTEWKNTLMRSKIAGVDKIINTVQKNM